jgi:hypothetical protein
VVETATNRPNSADQQTDVQELSAALDLDVQLIPSGLVITRFPVPVFETATNRPNSADQQTQRQLLSVALDLDVQLIPSGLVITRFPVPE